MLQQNKGKTQYIEDFELIDIKPIFSHNYS